MKILHAASLLAAMLPLASHAGERFGLGHELDLARRDVLAELSQERTRLERGNLALDGTFGFGKTSRAASTRNAELPKGEITPAGDLLVDGKAIAIDAVQRRQLLDYRAQVIDVARTGIDAGQKAALVAIDAADVSIFRLLVEGLSGSLERRVEAVVQTSLKPAMLTICHRLPKLRESQQALAAGIAAFRPYATLQADDAANCEADIQHELATR